MGALDVSYFLAESLSPDDRRAHERSLLERYHAGLVAGGVTGYSFDDLWLDYRIGFVAPAHRSPSSARAWILGNDRGRQLMDAMVERVLIAIDDHDAGRALARLSRARRRAYGAPMSDDMIFGAFLPQGWKMELSSIDGAEAKWAKAVEIAVLAEQLGYDSVWVYDHFHNVPRPAHEAVFECWTTLAAISQRTSRIRLGQMVGCNSYRQPSVLAKITSTIDVISGGRLDWGIGAGWYEQRVQGLRLRVPRARRCASACSASASRS